MFIICENIIIWQAKQIKELSSSHNAYTRISSFEVFVWCWCCCCCCWYANKHDRQKAESPLKVKKREGKKMTKKPRTLILCGGKKSENELKMRRKIKLQCAQCLTCVYLELGAQYSANIGWKCTVPQTAYENATKWYMYIQTAWEHHLLVGPVFALDHFAFVDEIKGLIESYFWLIQQINDKLFH